MNHDPKDRASAADLPPELLRRLREVEQLLRESGNPDPDQPDPGLPQDGTTPQPDK
jgi:hypothetical protein